MPVRPTLASQLRDSLAKAWCSAFCSLLCICSLLAMRGTHMRNEKERPARGGQGSASWHSCRASLFCSSPCFERRISCCASEPQSCTALGCLRLRFGQHFARVSDMCLCPRFGPVLVGGIGNRVRFTGRFSQACTRSAAKARSHFGTTNRLCPPLANSALSDRWYTPHADRTAMSLSTELRHWRVCFCTKGCDSSRR